MCESETHFFLTDGTDETDLRWRMQLVTPPRAAQGSISVRSVKSVRELKHTQLFWLTDRTDHTDLCCRLQLAASLRAAQYSLL